MRNESLNAYVLKSAKCALAISAIFFMVGTVWLIISRGNLNIFCYDDNLTQWLPVINDIFSDLFQTGRLNIWNFYLMGGINVLDTGIYSILNPFMLLGFLIHRLSGVSNTITICIYLTVAVAMCIYYYAFRKNGLSVPCSFAVLYCLLACSSFYNFGHWYYVFNNLLIGSLVLLYFSCMINGKYKYIFLGIVLGESIYLGNVQYTVMWYIAVGLIILSDIMIAPEFQKIKICNYSEPPIARQSQHYLQMRLLTHQTH